MMEKPSMLSGLWRLAGALSLLGAISASGPGCNPGGKGGDALDENLIRTAALGDIVDEVSEAGKIAPSFDVDIKSKVSGEVQAVHVEEGQLVKKGDLLYEIVDTEYVRNVNQARVSLSRAQLQAANARDDDRRNKGALDANAISQAEYDASHRAAELADLEVQQARIEYDRAREQLAYTKITAPIDGVVIVRNVEPGEVVTAGVTATVNGEAQLTIAQMDRLLLEIDLNQVDVAKIARDQEARILLDAYPDAELPGVVRQIAAAGHNDPARSIDVFTVKVEVDPSKAEVEIKPGMTAEVRVRIGTYANVLKLPAETVFEEDGKSYVFAVREKEGKKVKEKTEIQIGHRSDREVEVTSGLSAGDSYYAAAEVKDLGAKID